MLLPKSGSKVYPRIIGSSRLGVVEVEEFGSRKDTHKETKYVERIYRP